MSYLLMLSNKKIDNKINLFLVVITYTIMYYPYSGSSGRGGFSCWVLMCYYYRDRRDESCSRYVFSFHWIIDIFKTYGKILTFLVTRTCLRECKTYALVALPLLILIDIILIIITPLWFIFETVLWLIMIAIIILLLIIGNILLCCIPLMLLCVYIKRKNEREEREERCSPISAAMFGPHIMGGPYASSIIDRHIDDYPNYVRSNSAPPPRVNVNNTSPIFSSEVNDYINNPLYDITSESNTSLKVVDKDIETGSDDIDTETETETETNTEDINNNVIINTDAYSNIILNHSNTTNLNTSDIPNIDLNELEIEEI